VVGTATAATQSAAAVAQSFQTASNSQVVAGALVSLTEDNSIQPATADTAKQLVGVAAETPLLTLSGTGNDTEAQVVITGNTPVLVSDINGSIKTGDKITASPLAGIGMKATGDGNVIGVAQETFNASAGVAQKVKDRSGIERTVHVGQVAVSVNVSYYAAPTSQFLPPFLQKLANSVAGRPVSLVRALIACLLLILAIVIIATMLFGAIRSAITSIGRNPLASRAINRGLVQVIVASILILAFALLAVYLILAV